MLLALLGGALIGLSASLFWSLNGRIAGVSGVFADVFRAHGEDRAVRFAFLLGLVLVGAWFGKATARIGTPSVPLAALALAGLLVGVGTRLGNGCTSGHGVCGLSRLSLRSLVAVCTFMATGAITVFFVRHVLHLGSLP